MQQCCEKWQKSKCKAFECCVNKGDSEKERKEIECASVQLVKNKKGDVEKSCVMYKKLKEDSGCTEAMCETLLSNLKD